MLTLENTIADAACVVKHFATHRLPVALYSSKIRIWKLLETAGSQNGNDRKVSETAQNGDESTVDVAFLHSEVARLESELETAGKREATLEARTDKLISMLAIEQEQTRLLMLPKPEPEPEQKQKKRGSWLGYFRLKR